MGLGNRLNTDFGMVEAGHKTLLLFFLPALTIFNTPSPWKKGDHCKHQASCSGSVEHVTGLMGKKFLAHSKDSHAHSRNEVCDLRGRLHSRV